MAEAVVGGIVGAIVGSILTMLGAVILDRSKRSTPNYNFIREDPVLYQDSVSIFGHYATNSGSLDNCILIKNYGTVELFNVSTSIYFKGKRERSAYQKMNIKEEFNLEIGHLSTPLPFEYERANPLYISIRSREETIEQIRETGFVIDESDMEKLKTLKSIKIKVEYEQEGKKDSDIWLFDFSDESEVQFYIFPPRFWQNLKRRFL